MSHRKPNPADEPGLAPKQPDDFCPSESDAAAAPALPASSLSSLMSGQLLRDGEIVLLMIRPSRWFILLSSLKFLAVIAILMSLAVIYDERLRFLSRSYIDAGVFAMSARLMWATLQWMGRLYILTDRRILRVAGVFAVDVFECPLRKVARTILDCTFREKLCRIGSIVIIPEEERSPLGTWRMVSRPAQVHERIVAAISRAKQGNLHA